jgi:hypothetical protein
MGQILKTAEGERKNVPRQNVFDRVFWAELPEIKRKDSRT